jgi:hypothetical protein
VCIIAYRTAELCKTALGEMMKKDGDFRVSDRTTELERRKESSGVACAISAAERVWKD